MSTYTTKDNMIDDLTLSVSFTGKELYETIKLYDILRDMDFELTDTQVEVFERLQDAEDEDDLIEEVTTACGWCIKSIDYDIQLK